METIEAMENAGEKALAVYEPAPLMPVAKAAELVEAHKAGVELIRNLLEPKVDYGQVPGTDKNTLFKAGAERLMGAYGMRPEYRVLAEEADHDRPNQYVLSKWTFAKTKPAQADADRLKAEGKGRWKKTGDGWKWQDREDECGESLGLYSYSVECSLYIGDRPVGSGIGSCSTMESKYVRAPRDMGNTVLKMAKKRAFVDAVLGTLGLSDRFTQDVEDMRSNAMERGDAVDAEIVEEPAQPTPDAREKALRLAVDALFEKLGLAKDRADKSRFESFKRLCQDNEADWRKTLVDAAREGCEDWDSLVEFASCIKPYTGPTVSDDDQVEEFAGE